VVSVNYRRNVLKDFCNISQNRRDQVNTVFKKIASKAHGTQALAWSALHEAILRILSFHTRSFLNYSAKFDREFHLCWKTASLSKAAAMPAISRHYSTCFWIWDIPFWNLLVTPGKSIRSLTKKKCTWAIGLLRTQVSTSAVFYHNYIEWNTTRQESFTGLQCKKYFSVAFRRLWKKRDAPLSCESLR